MKKLGVNLVCATCDYLYKDMYCHENATLALTCDNIIAEPKKFWCGSHSLLREKPDVWADKDKQA